MAAPADIARQIDLKYITDEAEGWKRRRHGRGFSYCREGGDKITQPDLIERLRSLGIPPAWKDVWICPDPQGHLQATGRDEKGRKQYIYHPDWMAFQQTTKFQRMVRFAELLPEVRRRLARDLRRRQWDRVRVLAVAVSVLDECGIRIGNRQYATSNGTYGLTTLRRKHMDIDQNGLRFSYTGKSGQQQEVDIHDPRLARLVQQLAQLPGYEIFRYRDENGKMQVLDSSEVNAYIQDIIGEDFSSKDFRTWNATAAAVEYYEDALEEIAENPRRKLEKALVDHVARFIGNTPAVCRKYYIHPAILRHVEEETMPLPDSVSEEELARFDGQLEPAEVLTYRLISE